MAKYQVRKTKLNDYLYRMLGPRTMKRVLEAMEQGKTIVIEGNNGTGKTTLMNVLNDHGYKAVEERETCHVYLHKRIVLPTENMRERVE